MAGNTIGRLALLVALNCTVSALCLLPAGCSTRGFLKPRSQIIDEAKGRGVPVRSVEEDREAFFELERQQFRQLASLIENRAGSEFRDATYRIGPGDEFEVNVFDVPELNVTAAVRQSGFVSLPLVGAVKAAGLTEGDFVDELKTRLRTFVRNPEVSVYITRYASHKVAVMGAVRKPGSYALRKGDNNVLELIGRAGGLSEKAGNYLTLVPAEATGKVSEFEHGTRAQLDLVRANLGASSARGVDVYLDQVMGTSGGVPIDIPVRAGDLIVIPEAGRIVVEGEVQQPGSIELSQQMTLLTSLAAAGGITYGAAVNEVEVVRDTGVGEGKARLVVSLERMASGEEKDVRLRNGDIVRVPSDSGRRLTQDTFEGLSRIINFGVGGTVSVVK